MIYRALDPNGDYSFGQDDFLSGPKSVGQAIVTSLKLLKGEWWEDVNNGLPLWQSILGQPGSEVNKESVDNIIKDRIQKVNLNGELLVSSIDSYDSTLDTETRQYSFTAEITTIYSESVVIQESINLG